MSLKDAIREAVDERDKQQGVQGKPAIVDSPQDAAVPAEQAQPKRKPKVSEQQSNKAINTASLKYVNTASSKAAQGVQEQDEVDPEEKVELAALTIRVARQSRIHWLVSAKQQNTTLTAAITEALNARFGEAGK